MHPITPNLWFNDEAEAAVELYASAFKNVTKGNVLRYTKAVSEVAGRPEGSVLTVDFSIGDLPLIALNGGPQFALTPAISFFVDCETKEELQALWDKLSSGGKVLMELAAYPFSEYYGWCNDQFGVSWQLNFTKKPQRVTPSLMFVGDVAGKAKEAMTFYTSLFPNSSVDAAIPYEPGDYDTVGLKYAEFRLNGQLFRALDSSLQHAFTFNEAVSLMVTVDTQEELDALWDKLSAHTEAEQCGWMKDKYGVSWQVVPAEFNAMMQDKEPEKVERVMAAMLPMKKLDIAALRKAYEGA